MEGASEKKAVEHKPLETHCKGEKMYFPPQAMPFVPLIFILKFLVFGLLGFSPPTS